MHDIVPVDETATARFLAELGARVRRARARKGMSRRSLSEVSGISQRYLAQLESGKGNISMRLLLRIAGALDFSIEQMVKETEPLKGDAVPAGRPRASRVALIGLRGAGKSTLGRLAAVCLGVDFLELNQEIERSSAMPVHEVFALYGQEGYRWYERQSVERVAAGHNTLILAVAGGIVSEPETFTYLLDNYHTIWLKAEAQDHMARVRGQGDVRPMAGNRDAMQELHNILTSREAFYAKADVQVNTSQATLDESLAEVLQAIAKNRFMIN